MHARFAILGVAAATLATFACVDLFHKTDFATLCDRTPNAAGCAATDAQSDGAPQNLICAIDRETARATAARACAWLGACEGALGDNAFGPCMVHALLAYDCVANPNREVRGLAGTYWGCLANAKTCEDIARCVHPSGEQQCATTTFAYSGCEGAGGDPEAGVALNVNTRIECDGDGGFIAGENCAAKGQTCARDALGGAICVAVQPSAKCTNGCTAGSSVLHACEYADGGPIDLGTDCTSVGAGQCASPTEDISACLADSKTPCDASAPVVCTEGVASGCGSGVTEHVDCAAILGADAGACDPSANGASLDVTRACAVPDAGCGDDKCIASSIASCDRGVAFNASCTELGLGPCTLAPIDGVLRASCTRH